MAMQLDEIVQHLLSTTLGHDESRLSDGQLLVRYIERRDQSAVAALVRRHGPMIWGVCRRALGNHHDAEDAFQATFLVLLRKARSVIRQDAVGHWLYGVAHQTALKARTILARRRMREKQTEDGPQPQCTDASPSWELQAALDEELSRLPEKYRAAIVLCDLQGKSYKEAAKQLRCPEGTLAARLARGRTRLARRLTARGLALTTLAVAVALKQATASASVPASIVSSTIKVTALFSTGHLSPEGVISARVMALTEGVLKMMFLNKLRMPTAKLLIVLAGLSAWGLTRHSRAADPTVSNDAGSASKSDARPGADKSDKGSGEVVARTAQQIVSTFDQNRARVEEEYLGKRIRVTGPMYRIDRVSAALLVLGALLQKETEDDYYFLTLAVDAKEEDKTKGSGHSRAEMRLFFVFPKSERKQLAELERGQEVSIEGTCEGTLMQQTGNYVLFRSCRLVRSK